MAPDGAVLAAGDRGGVDHYGVAVLDELTERYGDLLTGRYDCVDRIVLNAYFSLGHNPGGFRVWCGGGTTTATRSWTTRI